MQEPSARPDSSIESPAAGIVVFRPDLDLLLPLIEAMLEQCAPVIVFLNGPHETLARLLRERSVQLIESDYNLGVAEALNILVLAAAWEGKGRLVLLDQDSRLPPAAVARMDAAMNELELRGERPAALGPKIVPPRDSAFRAPRMFPQPGINAIGATKPVRFLITSGTLLSVPAFLRIGRFRSDYFIDAIDTEWCFRAWRRGFSCWVRTDVSMEHRIGSGIMKAPFGPPIPLQTDMRLYSYVRNQAHGMTLSHVPLMWKVNFALLVVRLTLVAWAHHGFSWNFLANMTNAMWRGIRGRLGPPPGAENTADLSESAFAQADSSSA